MGADEALVGTEATLPMSAPHEHPPSPGGNRA